MQTLQNLTKTFQKNKWINQEKQTKILKKIPYKGTRDFFPDEMRLRDKVFGILKNTAQLFNFEPYGYSILSACLFVRMSAKIRKHSCFLPFFFLSLASPLSFISYVNPTGIHLSVVNLEYCVTVGAKKEHARFYCCSIHRALRASNTKELTKLHSSSN